MQVVRRACMTLAEGYVTHRELAGKRLDCLSLEGELMNLPASFEDHYAGYNEIENYGEDPLPTGLNEDSFRYQLKFSENNSRTPFTSEGVIQYFSSQVYCSWLVTTHL